MHISRWGSLVLRAILVLAISLAPFACLADVVIPVPNGDFSNAANNGTLTGTLLSPNYNALVGAGPWRAHGQGLAGLLFSPNTNISGGVATFSNLIDISLPVLSNFAEIYNTNVGATFDQSLFYVVTADFTSTTFLADASVLSDAGVGIGLMANGSNVASTFTASPALVVLTVGTDHRSGTISMLYDATAADQGDQIGIRLFVGEPVGLLDVSVLGNISFDNVTLTSVPEPGTFGLATVGLLGLVWQYRRQARRAACLVQAQ